MDKNTWIIDWFNTRLADAYRIEWLTDTFKAHMVMTAELMMGRPVSWNNGIPYFKLGDQ